MMDLSNDSGKQKGLCCVYGADKAGSNELSFFGGNKHA